MAEEKQCFVIAPIGEPESETRKRSDQVLKHIIAPAVEACGYKAIRADQIDTPGIITSQIIQHMVDDPLVVADLSETNPNVFYELAIRHAIRKPLIQIIRKGDRIPFDVAGMRTIQVDHHDLDSVEAAKKEMIDQIKSVENDHAKIETPISVSLDLQVLRQSDNPEERSMADIMSAVTDIRASLHFIETNWESSLDSVKMMGSVKNSIEELKYITKDLSLIGDFQQKRHRVDPFVFRKMTEKIFFASGDLTGILIIFSFYRDDFPWLYELGVQIYHRSQQGNWDEVDSLVKAMKYTIALVLEDKMGSDYAYVNKELVMFMEDLPLAIDKITSEARKLNVAARNKKISSG